MTARPRVGVTVGDPAGIGPEIATKAAADPRVTSICEPVLYGPHSPDELSRFARGRVSPEAGRAAYDAVTAAVADALGGRIQAIATAPINKEAFSVAGLRWPGHTELLAHLTASPRVAMMFHSEQLRVVLATIHVPLAQVSQMLTAERLLDTIDLTWQALPRFGIDAPRLAVAGLNPRSKAAR